MKRVVVTGLGVVSCLGNNQQEVFESLINSKSGISYSEEYKEYNLKSHIHGKPKIKLEDYVDNSISFEDAEESVKHLHQIGRKFVRCDAATAVFVQACKARRILRQHFFKGQHAVPVGVELLRMKPLMVRALAKMT